MAGLLISGSAGSGKSAAAREELAASNEPAILAEIQPIYAALLGIERLPNGRFPERLESDAHALRMAEFLRRTILTAGLSRGLKVITSNSDSDLDRRQFLLRELGPGATERNRQCFVRYSHKQPAGAGWDDFGSMPPSG